jgi:hypothetical protein
MGLPFHHLLLHLRHLLWVAIWLGVSILLWLWSPPASIIFFGLGLIIYHLAIRRGAFRPPKEQDAPAAPNRELEAKFVVTQVLKDLTRIQVTYLCQSFESRTEARAWLKRALPRPYRKSLDELFRLLEKARLGASVPELKLAQRVLSRRDELLRMIEALEQAHRKRPTFVISNPVIFVITENLSAEPSTEPLVVTLAGWNPIQPTLLPQVDALTFFSELEGKRQIRGQADFEGTLKALSTSLTLLSGEVPVYATQPVEDPARLGVHISKVPMGFTIGAAELV